MDELSQQLRRMSPDCNIQESDIQGYTIWIDRTQGTVRFTGPDTDRTIQLDYGGSDGAFLCDDFFPVPDSALKAIHQLERQGYAYRDPVQTVCIDPESEGEESVDEEDSWEEMIIELLLFKIGVDDRFGFVLQDNVIISPYFIEEIVETGSEE